NGADRANVGASAPNGAGQNNRAGQSEPNRRSRNDAGSACATRYPKPPAGPTTVECLGESSREDSRAGNRREKGRGRGQAKRRVQGLLGQPAFGPFAFNLV